MKDFSEIYVCHHYRHHRISRCFSFHQYSGGFQHGIIFGIRNASTQKLHYDAGFEWRTG